MKRTQEKRTPADWFQPMTGCRARVDAPGGTAIVHFIFHEEEERLRIIGVNLEAHGVLDVASWRAFPLARVESRANEPGTKHLLLEYSDLVDVAPIAETLPIEVKGLLSLTVARPLRPPYPDSVYRQVADHYRWCVRWGDPPAQFIARINKVPVRTVYGWIREARRRGLLEPGRQGRAG